MPTSAPLLLPPPRPAVSVDATRRQFMAILAAAGLVTACGDPASPRPAASADTRRHTGAFGPVDVPVSPQRVMAMYATDADYASVLGLPLVGSYQAAPGSFPPYQAAGLDGVAPVSTFPEPDMERIAGLGPDLVLQVEAYYSPESQDELAQIAPVLSAPTAVAEAGEWRPILAELAGVFGLEDIARRFVSAYDERAAALRERLQQRWGGATFAYLGPMGGGSFYVAQANMQTNLTLAEDLGLPLASVVPATVEQRRTDISYEELGMLAAVDMLLLRVNAVADSVQPDLAATREITGSPLFGTLPAAQRGAVFEIPGDLFYVSPLTAQANLDWAEATLLG